MSRYYHMFKAQSKQYMSLTTLTMNAAFEEHFGAKDSSEGEFKYDHLSLDDFDLSREFECIYKYLPDITLQRISLHVWMIWYKGLNVTDQEYRNRTECLTNSTLIQIHRFVQDCKRHNNTFTVVTETGIKIEHIGKIDYVKKLSLKTKTPADVVKDIPVIQTSLTFDSFFHPNKFYQITPSLYKGQREFVTLRLHADNKWYVYIKDIVLSTIEVTDLDMEAFKKDKANCTKFIHHIRLAHAKGEFKFEALCDKCNNTKVLNQTVVEPAIYNGFKVNVHQQQEIPCTCTNNS